VLTKDNIMKLTDGLFHRVFDEIGAEYPEIAKEHMIIDIGAARLAAAPERFDVVVTPNLYGDIVSDIAAEVAGSVGLAGSANIGAHGAMFEAIHGSAPDIAGQGIANRRVSSWRACRCSSISARRTLPSGSTMPGSRPSRTACTPPTLRERR
jgi:isocitrate/isopropylmalate dehydrogenase